MGGDRVKSTVRIGICGRSGSGKSYVSSVFASFGGRHIDTDAVYHDLLAPKDGALSPCAAAIASEFGKVVLKYNTIDRKALGDIVFSDSEKLRKLNTIAHAYIKEEVDRITRRCRKPFVLIDAPVLFESGFDKFCDFTVCVVADEATLIERICRRDGVTKKIAMRRLATQIASSELEEKCDFTVDNSLGRDVTNDVRNILLRKGLVK